MKTRTPQERRLFAIVSMLDSEPYVVGLGDSFMHAVKEAREHAEDAQLPSQVFHDIFLVVHTSPSETYHFPKCGRHVSRSWLRRHRRAGCCV